MSFGVTNAGFVKMFLADIKEDIDGGFQQIFGTGINLLPASGFGSISGLVSDRLAALWDLAEATYDSQYPDTAAGISLDNSMAIVGNRRLAQSKSQVAAQLLFGVNGTLIPQGTTFAVVGNPLALFSTDQDATLGAGVNAVQKILFSTVPDAGVYKLQFGTAVSAEIADNANAAAVQVIVREVPGYADVVVTGNYGSGLVFSFSGASGFRPVPLIVFAENTLTTSSVAVVPTVSTTTVGVPQATVSCSALTPGPTVAPATTLTVIQTPITGLTGTVNLADANVGRNVELDPAARARRNNELQISGNTTLDAIVSKMVAVANVAQVTGLENNSMITDGNGFPAKSVDIFVDGGADQDIADALWKCKGGGIQAYGSTTKTVIDSQGLTRTVGFSRPIQDLVWVIVTITKNQNYPTSADPRGNGDAQVKAALLAYAATLAMGDDVLVRVELIPAIVAAVSGVQDIEVLVGLSNPPTLSDNLSTLVNHLAKFDSSRIVVNSS